MNLRSFIDMARKRSDDKRRRILQAAVKVFARKGYFASRVSEIAKRADVADGTIYLYFRGKEDILVSLFDEVMSEHVERARAEMQAVEGAPDRLRVLAEHHLRVLGAVQGAPEKLRTIARRHLGLLGGNRDLAVVFQVELRQSTKFMERFTASWLQDYFALVGEIIEEGQQDGSLRADLPLKLTAKAVFGILDEMVTSWILSKRDYDLAELAPVVMDLLLRGMAAPRKAATRPALAAAVATRGR